MNRPKRLIFLFLTFLSLVCFSLSNVQNSARAELTETDLSKYYKAEDWKLNTSIVRQSGAPPTLVIRFECVSGKGALIFHYSTILDFHIHIFDEAQAEVALNAEGKRGLAAGFSFRKALMKPLGPGQALSYEIRLDKYFDIAPGHSYEVRVRRYLTETIIPRSSVPEDGVRLVHIDASPIKFEWK